MFAEVRNRTGRVVGSRGRDILLTYTPTPIDAEPGKAQAHYWVAEWQAIGWSMESSIGLASALSVPLGRYRLSVTGTSQGKSYRVSSQPFSVVADDAIKLTASRTGSKLTGQAVYPVGDGFRLLRMSGPSDGSVAVVGSLKVTIKNGSKSETLTVSTTDGGFSLDTTLDVSAGVQLDVEDAAGNRGTLRVS